METFRIPAQSDDVYVRSLFRLSQESEKRKTDQGTFSYQLKEQPVGGEVNPPASGFSLNLNSASPLSPLRSRDVKALVDMFSHDQLTEIEADVHQYLHRLYPEPCWEIEPYELFLKGFL